MKTSNFMIWLGLFLPLLCIVNCTPRVKHTYCEDFTNKDSLIQRIVTYYDEDAYSGLFCCHTDSNMDLYSFLLGDSCGKAGYYIPLYDSEGNSWYGLCDTITLFYETKGVVMGCYMGFNSNRQRQISFPDSIYDVLVGAFHRYGVSAWDKDKYRSEYDNIDSLLNVVQTEEDIESYKKLRLLVSADTLLPVAFEIASKTHNPIACYDVYYNAIRGYRASDDKFQLAYQYLCEATDSMYYPAVFLKAGLCLTGAYFSPDPILGKKLLERCHGNTSIPFWQQYYKPVVYQHLLSKKKTASRVL